MVVISWRDKTDVLVFFRCRVCVPSVHDVFHHGFFAAPNREHFSLSAIAENIPVCRADPADQERARSAQAAQPPLQGHLHHEHLREGNRQGKPAQPLFYFSPNTIHYFWFM